MEKRSCPPGSIRDTLLKVCIPMDSTEQGEDQETGLVKSTVGPIQDWSAGLWITVCIVLIGSLLCAMLLCFIIYTQHCHRKGQRNSGSPPATPSSQQNGATQSLLPVLQQKEAHSSPCSHINGTTQHGPDCESDWGRGLSNMRVEHVVPLPATELGDSALVTTKTVQPVVHVYHHAP